MEVNMKSKERAPGRELPPGKTYGFEDILAHFERGENRLRTKRLAQPSALIKGDSFVTGENVVSSPRKHKRGDIFVQISKGFESGYWIKLPSSIPIALKSPINRKEGKFARAINLEKGDILATGVKLSSHPYLIEGASVSISLEAEDYNHSVRLLSNVPVALLSKGDPAPKALWSL